MLIKPLRCMLSALLLTGAILSPVVNSAEQVDPTAAPIGEAAASTERQYARTVTLPSFSLKDVVLSQDRTRAIPDAYKNPETRLCKPFCVQPEQKQGVKLLKLEDFPGMAAQINNGEVVLVDMRTPDWYAKGTLPGAINIPYTDFTGPVSRAKARLNHLGGKAVIAFCNGWWCGQSSAGLEAIVGLGYQGSLYSFRGGAQDWLDAGLPLIAP